jgi:hypothetical protein
MQSTQQLAVGSTFAPPDYVAFSLQRKQVGNEPLYYQQLPMLLMTVRYVTSRTVVLIYM